MIDTDDRALLHRSTLTRRRLLVTVSGCAFSCCGRGWRRRDGYEQTYRGYVGELGEDGIVLVAAGIGTTTYMMSATFDEVQDVSVL